MSGHNKWSTIKHKKAKEDAKRGKIFTKIIKEITVAARIGGGDPNANPRLRTAIANAKEANMPNDNIKKAIQRGTGELPGVTYEDYNYEGYGPGGCAVLVTTTTDNKNRTTAEVRHIFTKHGGSLGENGCVSWIFESKGVILIEKSNLSEEQVFEMVTECNGEDYDDLDDSYQIVTGVSEFEEAKKYFSDNNIKIIKSEIDSIPKTEMKVDSDTANKMIKLIDALDENDDVQNVYTNFAPPVDFELNES